MIGMRCSALQDQTIRFCETFVRPHIRQIRETGEFPAVLLQRLKDTGWFGLLIDKKYGGLGLDCLHRVVNVEHVARECPDLGAVLQIAQLGTASILEFGSDEQKLKWLPALADGRRVCTISITERHSGSHVLGMSTTYEEKAGGFVLNGEKCFIGNCGFANLHVVYAREKDGRAISAFIVEGEREGVDNTHSHPHAGLRAFPFGRLRLHRVFVPGANLLGAVGDGLRMAYHVIAYHGRPSLTSLALGIHHRILDLACSFAEQRQLYGRPIAELHDVRSKIFDIYSRFEQSRQVAYEAAEKQSMGQEAYRALSLAKYLSGEHVCHAANSAAEIFGARAGLPEFEIAQLGLDALMTRPPSGTGDVQKKRVMDDFLNRAGFRHSGDLKKGAA